MKTTPSYLQRTNLVIKSGAQALFDAFELSPKLLLSQLVPEPSALQQADAVGSLYYELLFGDEANAVEALRDRGEEIHDVYAYGAQPEVRESALKYMKLMSEYGATNLKDWRNLNWGTTDDCEIVCVDIQESLVLSIDGAGSLEPVAHALMQPYFNAAYNVVVVEVCEEAGTRIEVSKTQVDEGALLDAHITLNLSDTTKLQA